MKQLYEVIGKDWVTVPLTHEEAIEAVKCLRGDIQTHDNNRIWRSFQTTRYNAIEGGIVSEQPSLPPARQTKSLHASRRKIARTER